MEHRRRPRYRGTHPKRFEERYKEHEPDRYPQEAAHILAKGRTLAGSHRPILVEEILERLRPQPGDAVLDATLGYGGHAQELLRRILPGGQLVGLDVDSEELTRTRQRLEDLGFPAESMDFRHLNFAALASLVRERGGGFDCILADLGVSSMQLDNPDRGFSYKLDGPLDLRLDRNRGKPAWQVLASIQADKLARILDEYADEPQAEVLGAILAGRTLTTTAQLSALIRQSLPRLQPGDLRKTQQRTFMALRILVNEEFRVLDRFLADLSYCLKPGGRVAILTFHSGEDRRVKHALAEGKHYGHYEEVAPGPQLPTARERHDNPRSSCAKLRWAVRSALEL